MSAKGHEASGAAQQLATLCADASNLTDVTRNLMPVFSDVDSSSSVEPESPTTKAETEPADPVRFFLFITQGSNLATSIRTKYRPSTASAKSLTPSRHPR